ncbi:hypothetical protein Cgig2_008871 [Carnegiea gigantea]|uniref:Peptidase A1 domain-containing protein n=1 Tax=Carnegiea gigantea TaxID=171969 RepID=A0A9Q1GJA9_9CARY|nr:hypothetical protein Cgig2_008871 [Carnegiea gigantea]
MPYASNRPRHSLRHSQRHSNTIIRRRLQCRVFQSSPVASCSSMRGYEAGQGTLQLNILSKYSEDEDILIAIQNAWGPRSTVFVADVGLFVFSLIYHSCMVSELHRYPVLRKQIDHVVDRFLRDNLDPLENIIGHIIAMEELSFNPSHLGFLPSQSSSFLSPASVLISCLILTSGFRFHYHNTLNLNSNASSLAAIELPDHVNAISSSTPSCSLSSSHDSSEESAKIVVANNLQHDGQSPEKFAEQHLVKVPLKHRTTGQSENGPHYDPKYTSSFKNISCQDPCSNTTGDFALETFTVNLMAPSGKSDVKKVDNVMFGCGHWNRGLFHGASGLFGLGRGLLSFSSQLQSLYGHSFSYCLVDRNSGPSSKLIFGDDKDFLTHPEQNFTKLVNGEDNPADTFYYVEIKAIVIGGETLKIPEETWGFTQDGKGGTIVDSGTTLSYFAEPVYEVIKEAFIKNVENYPLMSDFPILEPCYNVSGVERLEMPSFKIQFRDGAEWNFPAENYFIWVDQQVVCLAMLGTKRSGFSIIGSYQQQNFYILYDTKNSSWDLFLQDVPISDNFANKHADFGSLMDYFSHM